jgi:hypothetical protein
MQKKKYVMICRKFLILVFFQANLRTKDVMKMNNTSHCFVHKKHPVTSLLYANPQILGTPISEQHEINGGWYSVTDAVFDDACASIHKELLSKTPMHFNFFDMKIRVKLADPSDTWMQLSNSEFPVGMGNDEKEKFYKNYLNSYMSINCKFRFKYFLDPFGTPPLQDD